MKKDLLDQLIRTCVREVINESSLIDCLKSKNFKVRECTADELAELREARRISEVDDTIGAPAPPAAGLGTAEQPAIPKKPSPIPTTPPKSESPPTSGMVMLSPRDPSKLQSIQIKYISDSQLERELQNLARSYGGPRAKRSLNSIRLAKDAIREPSSPTYFYIGKYDPESEELFLMADKDLNTAKENSNPPSDLGFIPTTSNPTQFEPTVASPEDFATRMATAGATPRYGIDELKKSIKKLVKEVFSE